jgi:hypothetical protein
MDTLLPWIFVAVGLFSLAGAIGDWEWFFGHRKAAFFVRLLGRTGGRIVYLVLGATLVTIGVLLIAGVLTMR